MITNTNIPVFAANQVLKNDHLNDLVNYLEEQTRVTRCKSIGIGILCGFEMSWSNALDNNGRLWDTLDVSEGVGITSLGYLIHSEKMSFSHRRRYLKKMEISQLEEYMASQQEYLDRYHYYEELADIYEFFKNDAGDDVDELYELVPVQNDKDEATALSKSFLNDKVLLIYLNCDLQSLKNCDVNDCDDKGAKLQFDVRYLLAPAEVANKIHNKEKELSRKWPAILSGQPYLDLKMINIEKPDFIRNGSVFSRHIYEGFLREVSNGISKIIEELNKSFPAFNPMLSTIYSAASRQNMIRKLEQLISQAKQLSGFSRYGIQYYYDFYVRLATAYNEFLECIHQFRSLCGSNTRAFPKHLFLGRLRNIDNNLIEDSEFVNRNPFISTGNGYIPAYEKDIHFRHGFLSSPQGTEQKDLEYKLRTLHFRMYEMVIRFNPAKILNKTVNVFPWKMNDKNLSSQPTIPGYFKVSDTTTNPLNKLKRLWSYHKTLKGELDDIGSFHTTTDTAHPLKYVDDSDFYRFEGHIGKDLSDAVDQIEALKRKYQLDFEIKLLKLGDSLTSKTVEGLPVNLFSNEIRKNPGLESMSGVPRGGTLYLAYRTITSRPFVLNLSDQFRLNDAYLKALGFASGNLGMLNRSRELITMLSGVSNKPGAYSEEVEKSLKIALDKDFSDLKGTDIAGAITGELDRIIKRPDNVEQSTKVVADFALSSSCCEASASLASLGVKECKYPWIDNYQFLNKYSWTGNRQDYVLNVLEYKIAGTEIIKGPVAIRIKLASIAHQKLQGITKALNLRFPEGLVFDTVTKDRNKITIKYFKDQPFTIKFRRNGSDDVYTYRPDKWLKNGKEVYNFKSECRIVPPKYNGLDYKALHEEYADSTEFVYEFPPTNDDLMKWRDLLKTRRINKFNKLPESVQKQLRGIYDIVLEYDPNAKIGLGGSWKSGSWATKSSLNEEQEFIELRKKISGKTQMSDLDIAIESDKKLNLEEIVKKSKMNNVNIIGIEKVTEKKYINVPKR